MKFSRNILRSVVAAIIVMSAAGCGSHTMTLTCDLSHVLMFYDEGATVDSVVVQAYSPDGDYRNLGYATIEGETARFSTRIGKPSVGRVKYYLTVPGGTGSSSSRFVAEPGTIAIDEMESVRGSKCNDAILGAMEMIQGCSDNPDAVKELFGVFSSRYGDAASSILYVKSFPLVDNELWLDVMDSMGETVSSYPEINSYKAMAQKQIAQNKAKMATAPGSRYTDFKGEWEGHEFTLSDYVNQGKYVLVDFWASWCMPCREEIPYIIRANDKYRNKCLAVIGVAVSDKPEDTARAMKSLGINYTVFNESDNSATNAYGIQTIPQMILISPDGTIIANGMRGEEIEETISRYL